ncbi:MULTISPECIES: hypothetical protein [unclassified Francisella]|uniref:hypothetical protein n=1 Tax=unclassified Francisella TaxID=2610885 RepID=UPI002E36C5BA|nr:MULTISPECIES: hypothetical protein [unclassified Francisella]MED7820227.1 hypothetical protein [Francisella sp. 19S2-4]MED7831075.1 hypothetical protein [Francisella sp. 19S2-10]
MNDEKFLERFIESINYIDKALPQQSLIIKDIESKYIYVSNYWAKLIGISPDHLINKDLWLPLYDNDPNIEKIVRQEEKDVIENKKVRIALKINRLQNKLTPYITHKLPIINSKTNNVVGVFCYCLGIGKINIETILQNALTTSVRQTNDSIMLSRREKQVIYLFMANLSSQEIASVISKIDKKKITKSTIDSLFNDQLYIKFSVYSRPELYKKLQVMGFDNLIPQELLKAGSTLLNSLMVY